MRHLWIALGVEGSHLMHRVRDYRAAQVEQERVARIATPLSRRAACYLSSANPDDWSQICTA
jgi:hypothetical protein